MTRRREKERGEGGGSVAISILSLHVRERDSPYQVLRDQFVVDRNLFSGFLFPMLARKHDRIK